MKTQYILTMTAIPLSNLFKYKRESAKNTMKQYSTQNSPSEQKLLNGWAPSLIITFPGLISKAQLYKENIQAILK